MAADTNDPSTLTSVPSRPHDMAEGRLALWGVLAVQAVVGYEWFMSGLTKIVHGDFVSGLGAKLPGLTEKSPGWYRSFVRAIVAPDPSLFARVVEFGELLLGVTLIVTAAYWAIRSERLTRAACNASMVIVALSTLAGAALALNLHLLNGSATPWLIPGDSFDGGDDPDSVLPAVQLVLRAFSVALLRHMRTRRHTGPDPGTGRDSRSDLNGTDRVRQAQTDAARMSSADTTPPDAPTRPAIATPPRHPDTAGSTSWP